MCKIPSTHARYDKIDEIIFEIVEGEGGGGLWPHSRSLGSNYCQNYSQLHHK